LSIWDEFYKIPAMLFTSSAFQILLFTVVALAATRARAGDDEPPPAPREFRAAWVASVVNIDWPSRPGLSTREQQREILAILDRAESLGLNALIVQIRTSADALYESKIEPWSVYLTGTQGEPPFPFYDPLAFWIEHAHRRGIEIHAWFNPYRAKAEEKGELCSSHVAYTRPEAVKKYGKFLWLDPGEPSSSKQSLDVFFDVVDRYDVDGIHIDDYFYPYPIQDDAKQEVPFPDDASWNRYQSSGGNLSRNDWRRENVNTLVRQIHEGVKSRKPWVKFGISPFGIGRPGTAPGIVGFDQYEKLHADAELWLREGWCDYFTPQLYWPIGQRKQSFPVLLDYWRSVNPKSRHVWPGMFTSRVIDPSRPFAPREIPDQIAVTRSRSDEPGHVHFSMKALMAEGELIDLLRSRTYTGKALVPASPWLDNSPPPAPAVRLESIEGRMRLRIEPASGEAPRLWAIRVAVPSETDEKHTWTFDVVPSLELSVPIDPKAARVVITAVDRCGNESAPVQVLLH
jgi:uncharacterized lipoprotein YddW (UPF0748 family)